MIGEFALALAIVAAVFSLGVFAGLAIAIPKIGGFTKLEERVRTLEQEIAKWEDEVEEIPLPRFDNKQADVLANIAANYGCMVIRSPSGEAYATYGTGTC